MGSPTRTLSNIQTKESNMKHLLLLTALIPLTACYSPAHADRITLSHTCGYGTETQRVEKGLNTSYNAQFICSTTSSNTIVTELECFSSLGFTIKVHEHCKNNVSTIFVPTLAE